MPPVRHFACLVALLAFGVARPASAAVLVVTNGTDSEQTVEVAHAKGDPASAKLLPGGSHAFQVGQKPTLVIRPAGAAPHSYVVEPYGAYVVLKDRAGKLGVQAIAYAAKMPAHDDVPEEPAPVKPYRFTVKALVDDADARAPALWQKAIRARVAEASDVLERQCGVKLDVVATEEWKGDPEVTDLPGMMLNFETNVKPAPAALAVGVTSRKLDKEAGGSAHLGGGRGPLYPFLLVREAYPKTEYERVEVLVHEVGHVLGAVHSPDRLSVMRTKLGDGLATNPRYRIMFDPLNLLAIHLWVDELRGNKPPKSWAGLSPRTRDRLLVVYKTISHAMPEELTAHDYIAELDRANEGRADLPKAEPAAAVEPAPEPPVKPMVEKERLRNEAIRKVVRAVSLRAGDLRNLGNRPKGDALTAEYIQTAADMATTLDDSVQASAFLIGLGIALDDSTMLRENPITATVCKAAETDEERKERISNLGGPTLWGRRDLCQHFAVSAALTRLLGPSAAETAGLAKELLDSTKSSGFSFADLAVDFAGVAFAVRVRKDPGGSLTQLAKEFKVDEFVPKVDGLREGITAAKFAQDYGNGSDPRFLDAVDAVRKRVDEMPAYSKK